MGLWNAWAEIPCRIEIQSLTTLCVSTAAFCLTVLFWDRQSDKNKKDIKDFYIKMETPIAPDEVKGIEDHRSLMRLGILVMIVGSGIFLLIFGGSLTSYERVVIAGTSLSLNVFGFVLNYLGRRSALRIKQFKHTNKASSLV